MFSVSILISILCFRKDPVLSCVHKSVEKCHYTYTTQFVPVTEEVVTTTILLKIFKHYICQVCDETYSKHCSITYKQVGQNDTLVHCYNPLVRDCVDQEEGGEAGDCREYQVQNVASYIL